MAKCLIGFSGFVGATLSRQTSFSHLYGSSSISESRGLSVELVCCAAAPAKKWVANREPEADRRNIESLMTHLKAIKCRTFVLISTVDVFRRPVCVDESTPVEEDGLHPYGLHRRMLETFVERHFSNHLIVRLPGLVGPGLLKNVVFDFLNDNNLYSIDSRGVLQFYPMVNLWYDIQTALRAGLRLVHLTAEPVSVETVSREGFGRSFTQTVAGDPPTYDLRTRHAAIFGGSGSYQYAARESIQAIRAYAQTEPRRLNARMGAS